MPGFGIRGKGKIDSDGVIREFELDSISLVDKPIDPRCRIVNITPITELLAKLKKERDHGARPME